MKTSVAWKHFSFKMFWQVATLLLAIYYLPLEFTLNFLQISIVGKGTSLVISPKHLQDVCESLNKKKYCRLTQ